MPETSAHQALASRDCRWPNCTSDASGKYDRGPLANLCDEHTETRREQLKGVGRGNPHPPFPGAEPKPAAPKRAAGVGFEQRARELVSVGKQLDQALRRVDVVKQRHDEEDRGRGERRRVELRPKQDAVNEALAAWKQTLQRIADAA